MTAYTVELAEEKKHLPAKGDYSEKVIYDVLFSDGSNAEIFQNVGTPPPARGDGLEGTIAPGNFPGAGPKCTKDKGAGSPSGASGGASNARGSGGGGWTPKKEKEVTMQATLKVAVALLQVRAYQKADEVPYTNEELWNHATLLREKVEAL